MTYAYEYPRPAVSTDCVVFGLEELALKLLLIQRRGQPFQGQWALPGGFVEIDESLDSAARRELNEETGLANVSLEQLAAFGAVQRDPRTRVISVAYFGLVNPARHKTRAASDAAEADWFSIAELPTLAFDHKSIVDAALIRLKQRVRLQPVGYFSDLLSEKFTLSELRSSYETILDRVLDERDFQAKILESRILVELPTDGAQCAMSYYRFEQTACDGQRSHTFWLDI